MRTPIATMIALALATAAFAQEGPAPDADPTPAPVAVETAPVKIDGDELFRLRGNSSFHADRRAADVTADEPKRMARLYSALHQNILDVFNEYGVQIMTPNYEGDPEQRKVVPKEQWYTAPAQKREPEQG